LTPLQETRRELDEARENIRYYKNKAVMADRPKDAASYRGLATAWQTTAAAKEKALRDAGEPVPLFSFR
jgi:hypothetical protein